MWTHQSPGGSSSGQSGRVRTLTTTPVGLKSLMWIVEQFPESTAACWANDIENMRAQPIYQIGLPALVEMHGVRPLSMCH